MNSIFKIIFVAGAMLSCLEAYPQSVAVSVVMRPPYSSYYNEYENLANKVIITLVNDARPKQVILFGLLRSLELDQQIFTRPGYVPPGAISLGANETKVIMTDAQQLRFLQRNNVESTFPDEVWADILRTGLLPESNWELCVAAVSVTIDPDGNPVYTTHGQSCFPVNMNRANAPIITSPFSGQSIPAQQPNMAFSWTPPIGNLTGAQLLYDLYVVKLMSDQNPNDAINAAVTYKANNPLVKTNLTVNQYVTQPFDLKLDTGFTYAVQIIARDMNRQVAFQNDGRSEVVTFTLGYQGATILNTGAVQQQNRSAGKTRGVRFSPNLRQSNLNVNTFKGKLVWAFRKSEQGVHGPSTIQNKGKDVLVQQNNFSQAANVFESPSGGNSPTYFVYGGGSTQGYLTSLPEPKDLQKEKQEKIISLIGDNKRYPMAHTSISLELYMDPALFQQLKNAFPGAIDQPGGSAAIKPYINLGKVKTDKDGNFSLPYHGALMKGYSLQLTVHSPYFEFADLPINIQTDTNGVYDIGEMTGIAKTIRLKVNVTDQDGNKLDAAKVEISRPAGYYSKSDIASNLQPEVMREQLGTATELAGKSKPGETYTRVFVSDHYTDRYTINVFLEKGPGKKTGFFCSASLPDYLEEGVPVIEKTYKITMPNPIVKGRVVNKKGFIPLKGANVIIGPNTDNIDLKTLLDNKFYFGKTNDSGKFELGNIPASPQPYALWVEYKGKKFKEPKLLYLTQGGMVEERDPILVNAAMLTVCGTVKDKNGQPIPYAQLHWKEGGEIFTSDETGRFYSAQTEGKHIIVVQRSGYRDLEQELTITDNNNGKAVQLGNSNKQATAGSWSNAVSASQGNAGKNFFTSIAGLGNVTGNAFENGVTYQEAAFGKVYKQSDIIVPATSCNHNLVMLRFFVRATIKDAGNNNPIAGAIVQPEESNQPVTTGSNGVAVVSDLSSGSPYIIIKGPATSLYTTVKTPVTIDNTKDTVNVEVLLKAGSKVSGKVRSKGSALPDAEVYVVGKEFISVKAGADGSYVLNGVPQGEYGLRAAKSGLLSDDTTIIFQPNQSYTADFNLADPGFNASSIYGFTLTLNSSTPGSNANEFIISGELANLPDNSIFKKTSSSLKIKFSNLTVVKTGNTIVAKSGEIKTDDPEIELLAFNYAKVRLKSQDGLRVIPLPGDNTKGEIVGEALLDVAGTFTGLSGWKLPASYLDLLNGTNTKVGAISSTGSASINLKLKGPADGMEVYTVKLKPDWNNSAIGTAGLSLKGTLDLSAVPLLSGSNIKLEKLLIEPSGKVKEVSISVNPQPEISLLSWKLKIAEASLSPLGLSFGGNMDVPVPSSATAKIGFANLQVSASGLKGGDFYFPAAGIDVLGIVKFKAPAGTQFSMQSLPGSQHYQLIGSGHFGLPKYISANIELSNFSIRTDGHFGAAAKTGFSTDFAGLAKLDINNIAFNTALKEVTVGGKFFLNLPGFGLGAQGNIHYRNSSITVDELGIKFNLSSAVGFEAKVNFKNENEFSGDGSLSLGGLADNIGASFFYKKVSGGINAGATFKPGVVIPIGIVKLDNLSGGFSLNTSTKTYKVFADGRITFAADPSGIVALDPVHIEITSTPQGPSLFGSADAKLMNAWTIGKAKLLIDYPKKLFYVDGTMGAGFNLMKGFPVEAKQGAHLELSALSGNSYWFFSYYMHTQIAHFLNANVTIAGGWGVGKSQHSSLAGIPDYVLAGDGKLYGGYFGAASHIGGSSPTIGVEGMADVSAWYNNDAEVTVYANVKAAKFGFRAQQNWSAGGEADFLICRLPVQTCQ